MYLIWIYFSQQNVTIVMCNQTLAECFICVCENTVYRCIRNVRNYMFFWSNIYLIVMVIWHLCFYVSQSIQQNDFACRTQVHPFSSFQTPYTWERMMVFWFLLVLVHIWTFWCIALVYYSDGPVKDELNPEWSFG